MKQLIAVSVLALCSAAAAQDAPAKQSTFDAERTINSCKAKDPATKYLKCYASLYNFAHIILELDVSNALIRVQMPRPNKEEILRATDSIDANIKGAQAVNRAFVPLLREEMKDAPAALALLPKLHAAFDVAVTGEMFEFSESKMAFRARVAKNHAAVVQLLKEIEFSQ